MPHKKLFIFLVVFGLGAKYLQEAHGVDFYVIKDPNTTELSLGWIAGIGGLIGCGLLFLRSFGFFDEKPEEEAYYQDDEYQEEYHDGYQDEEIYQQETKITWWNDNYEN